MKAIKVCPVCKKEYKGKSQWARLDERLSIEICSHLFCYMFALSVLRPEQKG